ncbi:MAG: hypothetical protein QOG36_887, partial [Actinomycetota bacterium]|nr:hypothetical protein [Actinomycetota bacterium]
MTICLLTCALQTWLVAIYAA